MVMFGFALFVSSSVPLMTSFLCFITALEGLGDDDDDDDDNPTPPPKSGKRRPASQHAHKTAAGGPVSITTRLPRGVTAI